MSNIKSIMDSRMKHLKIDAKFLKAAHLYGTAWLNKSEEHIKFFGGNLLGVYPIRYTSSDRNEWLDELLGLDEYEVRKEIISLPHIDEDWKRGTDVVNLSCVYLCHAIANTSMSHSQKEQGMIDVLLIMQYKLLSSLMAHFFRYPADEKTALATYAALSKKYAIKQHGTWYGVLLARCKDIISTESIHHQTIVKFDDDAAIMYMITDIQGRLRNMIKNLWGVFDLVRTQDAKILTTGGTIVLDGKTVVRDMTRNLAPYTRYLKEVVVDKARFIKVELVEVIASAQHTMPEALLYQALNYISEHHNDKKVDEFLTETLLHAFENLRDDARGQERMHDLAAFIAYLRSLYMASRSSDPTLLKMRELGQEILEKSISSRSESTIASVRTGVSLYVVLRSFSRSYYG